MRRGGEGGSEPARLTGAPLGCEHEAEGLGSAVMLMTSDGHIAVGIDGV